MTSTALVQMTSQVDGVRPAVISLDSCQNLNRYRSFRHVVRHIYPFDLEASPIEELIAFAEPTFTKSRSGIDCVCGFSQASRLKLIETSDRAKSQSLKIHLMSSPFFVLKLSVAPLSSAG